MIRTSTLYGFKVFSTLALLSSVSLAQVATPSADPFSPVDRDVVSFVDVSKYAGLWYEIASIPASFQSFCQFTTATYEVIAPDEISVANKCKVGFVPISIFGTAKVVDKETNAVLEVSFGNVSRKGDYRIVELDSDYTYALVTNASRDSFFVLSRNQTMDENLYNSLLTRAEAVGVDVSKVKKTKQN